VSAETRVGVHWLARLREKVGGRDFVEVDLEAIVRSHYVDPAIIADDVAHYGYEGAARVLREQMPAEGRSRSGDMGEILATEYVNRLTDFHVPVFRLRFKDGRELALRGDDLIGVRVVEDRLNCLKGEAKSRIAMAPDVIAQARAALDNHGGEPSKHSLGFVSCVLLRSSDPRREALGRLLRNAMVARGMPRGGITHMIFALSGNDAAEMLRADLAAYGGDITQRSVSLVIEDHAVFISAVFDGAVGFGGRAVVHGDD
jgi:hypothetical protein